jgi:proline racemase
MVSQLENDRIRIFGRIKAPEGKSLRDNLIVSPNGLSEMRGNFVISPNNPPTHMSPIVVNSEKRFISPMQSERVVTRPIVNHFKNVPIQQPSLRVI